jgi:hypothetical protein
MDDPRVDREGGGSIMRKLFLLQMAGGMMMIVFGFVFVPVVPYALLDAVLTEEQLRDEALRYQTLSFMQRAVSHELSVTPAFGLFVVVTSGVGLWLSGRAQNVSNPNT